MVLPCSARHCLHEPRDGFARAGDVPSGLSTTLASGSRRYGSDRKPMKPPRLWIGLGQIPIRMGDKRTNVAAIFAMMSEAAAHGCDVLVLPECSLAGWLSPAAKSLAEPIPGPFTRKLCVRARHYGMAVVLGLEERMDGLIFNSAIFIDEGGRILLRHRKINELEIGRSLYRRGSSIQVAEWKGRTIGLSICADSWRPEITDALCLMGAGIIFSPSAWATERGSEATNIAWITQTYRQRIGSRDLLIVAPNGVGTVTEGPWKGRVLQGNSLVIGKGGVVHARGKSNEPELLYWETK
jgi:predicted amidohydrolase